MPNLVVLVWNIETYGAYPTGLPHNLRATYDDVRNKVIAKAAALQNASVLVMQELKNTGIRHLENLRLCLNGETGAVWHFDWIPCGVNTARTVNPPKPSFKGVSNAEAYAVFWSNGALGTVTSNLSTGMDRQVRNAAAGHFIELCFKGATVNVEADTDTPISIVGNGSPALDLLMPLAETAKIVRQGKRSKRLGLAPQPKLNLRWEGVRRPAAISMTINGRTVPLVVYHAPNQRYSAYYGALLAFSSWNLFNGPPTTASIAGDYNIIDTDDRGDLGNYMASESFPGSAALANQQSMVHPTDKTHTIWRQAANVRTNQRDYGFYKNAPNPGITGVTVTVVNLLTTLTGAGQLRAFIRGTGANQLREPVANGGYGNLIDQIVTSASAPASKANVWAAWRDGTPYPAGTNNQTAAALVYNQLFSDHLPVKFTFTHP